jgi:hypothetical protein
VSRTVRSESCARRLVTFTMRLNLENRCAFIDVEAICDRQCFQDCLRACSRFLPSWNDRLSQSVQLISEPFDFSVA